MQAPMNPSDFAARQVATQQELYSLDLLSSLDVLVSNYKSMSSEFWRIALQQFVLQMFNRSDEVFR